MQHNRAGRKLRRTTAHRLAMFSNQLASLMTHERIQTTISKAKELRPLAGKLITTAKNDGVAARRRVYRWIPDH
jgi:large subunit ribosomal protein L17